MTNKSTKPAKEINLKASKRNKIAKPRNDKGDTNHIETEQTGGLATAKNDKGGTNH